MVTVVANIEREPRQTHGVGIFGLSIRLALELDAADAAERAIARGFFRALEDTQLYLYFIRDDDVTNPTPIIYSLFDQPLEAQGAFDAAASTRFDEWLSGSGGDLTSPGTTECTLEADAASANKRLVLLSAGNWTAPIPQEVGLTWVGTTITADIEGKVYTLDRRLDDLAKQGKNLLVAGENELPAMTQNAAEELTEETSNKSGRLGYPDDLLKSPLKDLNRRLLVIPAIGDGLGLGSKPPYSMQCHRDGDQITTDVGVAQFNAIANDGSATPVQHNVKTNLYADFVDDETSLVDLDTGYLHVPQFETADFFSLHRRITRRAGSVLWAAPAVLSLDWRTIERELEANYLPFDTAALYRTLIWQAVSFLSTLLDPLWTALSLPLLVKGRKGALVEPFVETLFESFEQLTNMEDSKRQAFAEAIAKSARAMPIFQSNTQGGDAHVEAAYAWVSTCLKYLGVDGGKLVKTSSPPTYKDQTGVLVPLLQTYIIYSKFDGQFQYLDKHLRETVLPELNSAGLDLTDVRTVRDILATQLNVELSPLFRSIQSEGGVEGLIKTILGERDVSSAFDATLALDPQIAALGTSAEVIAAITAARGVFYGILDQGMNGADTMRAAVGDAVFALLMPDDVPANKHRLPEAIAENLRNSEYFARRLTRQGQAGGPLAAIVQQAPRLFDSIVPQDESMTNIHLAALPSMIASLADAAAELIGDARVRFLPDSEPQPLPIQIALDLVTEDGGQDVDKAFAARFNGIGVIINRKLGIGGEGDTELAHVNLVTASLKVKETDADDPTGHRFALLPMQPADMDGGRQLFLTYEGSPFALVNDALSFPDGTEQIDVRQFYKSDYPVADTLFARPPALMYGAQFNVAAHVVSKAGTLPIEARQGSPEPPWNAAEAVQQIPTRFVDDRYYSRTTAIGRTAFAPEAKTASRLGHPDTVQPLLRDYPRLTVGAGELIQSAFVDLYRSRNGVGSVARPLRQGERIEVELRDVAMWGDQGKVRIELLVDPTVTMEALAAAAPVTPDGPRIGGWDIDLEPGQGPLDFRIVFENRYGDENVSATLIPRYGYEQTIDVSGTWNFVWLRLSPVLSHKNKRSTLSLADPDGGLRDGVEPGSNSKEPILLIGESSARVWLDRFTTNLEREVIFPRVGFVDFDRWVTNPLLGRHAGLDKAATLELRTAALHAYQVREIDQDLATLVQNMPDLAVDALLVEVAPYDGLADSIGALASERGCSAIVWLPKLANAFAASDKATRVKDPAAWLQSLSTLYQATLIVTVGPRLAIELSASCKTRNVDKTDPRTIKVSVPVGFCLRVTLRPLVPQRHFSVQTAAPVIASGIQQHAEAEVLVLEPGTSAPFVPANYLVFGGLSLSVECLLGDLKTGPEPWRLEQQDWTTTLAEALEFRPAGRAREYGFELNGQKLEEARRWQWRQIGWMDVASQRWRFTGRPIYTGIKPTNPLGSTVAAVRLAESTHEGLRAFQEEVFAERDDLDADIESVKLQPMPSTTPLTRMKWELPSATMFRHRFTVRSRYAGAMLPSAMSAQRAWAVNRDKDPGEDWVSVAMLADAEAIELSRPRLRAFVPSTSSVEDPNQATAGLPPILAFVEERPLGHGGLAEVMSGEIVTGLVWDTKSKDPLNPEPSLHIVGLRAQAGPSPTNSLLPFDFDHSYGVRSEGPIGLGFSSANAAVPSFKNTLLVLHPEVASSGGPHFESPSEEMAFSFALRRYLDPRWTIAPALRNNGDVGLSGRAYWFITDNPNGHTPTFGMANPAIINASDVLIESKYLAPKNSNGRVKLATIDPGRFKKIGFLHTPLGPGRADLAVYAIPDSSSGNPLDRRPVMVGSVQWVDPDNSGPIVPDLSNELFGFPTVASPPTSMYWTMNLRDADTVYARKGTGVEKIDVASLKPVQSGGLIRFFAHQEEVRLGSLMSFKREATEVMQRVALLAGRRVAGIGGASEELVQATVLRGSTTIVPDDVDYVRILHFETSSPAMRWPPDGSIDPRYRAAVFNRLAIAGSLAGRSVTFTLEPIATNEDNRSDIKQINLLLSGTGARPIPLPISPQRRSAIATIDLQLLPVEGRIAVHIIYDNEDTVETTDILNGDIDTLLRAPLIYLSVDGMVFHVDRRPAPTEMWWHGALLADHQPQVAANRAPADASQSVNFDWFFTEAQTDPSEAISVKGLEGLRQAQARIISVSRRIAVVRK